MTLWILVNPTLRFAKLDIQFKGNHLLMIFDTGSFPKLQPLSIISFLILYRKRSLCELLLSCILWNVFVTYQKQIRSLTIIWIHKSSMIAIYHAINHSQLIFVRLCAHGWCIGLEQVYSQVMSDEYCSILLLHHFFCLSITTCFVMGSTDRRDLG